MTQEKLKELNKTIFTYWQKIKATAKELNNIDYIELTKTTVRKLREDVPEEASKIGSYPIKMGLIVILGFLGFFFLWAAFAPLNSAAIAMGNVVVDSNRKTIQHLEGGIIHKIHVKEGQRVTIGEVLIELNATTAKANLNQSEKQLFGLKAKKERLETERDQKDTLDLSELNIKSKHPKLKDILDGEKNLFKVRHALMTDQIKIMEQRILQIENEIDGLNAQKKSVKTRVRISNKEVKNLKGLMREGYSSLQEVSEKETQLAELTGNMGSVVASIAKAKQSIIEAETEKIHLKTNRLNEVVAELQETQTLINDVEERVEATKDTLKRVVVLAPASGIITGLKYHTIGGVISPATPIMDIVPDKDEMLIEAQVNPQDIDLVRPGLEAKVRLSAYKAKNVPTLEGKIVHVSADRFNNESTGEAFYLARVTLSQGQMKTLEGVELYPGMPAEVYIVTGSRTPLGYLMSPILDTMRKAFKEE